VNIYIAQCRPVAKSVAYIIVYSLSKFIKIWISFGRTQSCPFFSVIQCIYSFCQFYSVFTFAPYLWFCIHVYRCYFVYCTFAYIFLLFCSLLYYSSFNTVYVQWYVPLSSLTGYFLSWSVVLVLETCQGQMCVLLSLSLVLVHEDS